MFVFTTSKKIQKKLSDNFELHQLDKIEQIHINKKTYYQLEIEQSFTEVKKLFDENGNLINNIPVWD